MLLLQRAPLKTIISISAHSWPQCSLLTVEYKVRNNLLYTNISALEFASLISSSELILMLNPRSNISIVVSKNGELGTAGESSLALRLAVACCTAVR